MSAIFTSEPRLALPEYRLKRIVSLPTLELLGGAFVQEVHDMGWGAFVLRLMLSPCTTARQMQRCPSFHRPIAHGRRQTRVSYKPSWSPSTGSNSAFSKSVRLAVQKSNSIIIISKSPAKPAQTPRFLRPTRKEM